MAAPKIVLDAFVKNVRPDPKAADPIIFLCGYLGDSPVEGNVRVYADPQLSSFVDVPRNAILHAVQNTSEEDSIGGSKLWIKQSDIANQAPPGSSYLEGDIYSHYATNMFQPGIPPHIPIPPTVHLLNCTRTSPIDPGCRSIYPLICQSQLIIRCPTQFGARSLCRPCLTNYNSPLCRTLNLNQCRSLVVVQCTITRNPPCELQTVRCSLGGCPSWVDGCPTTPGDFTTVVNPTVFQTVYEAGTFNPHVHGGY